MRARSPTIDTWSKLARALARRAEELRARWLRLGQTELVADTRAQRAICALLASYLLQGGDRPASWGGGRLARLRGLQALTSKTPPPVATVVRRIQADLEHADMQAVLRDLDDRYPGTDPVTGFYEQFLAAYDARQRMRRGVFYTPQPIAGFIVRTVHERLQQQFNLADGLAAADAARDIRILDPAAGTGVFLVEIIDLLHRTLCAKWRAAGRRQGTIPRLWSQWVSRVLSSRLIGYELMPAACTLANLNVALKLRATGCRDADQRTWVHAGNSLELLAGKPPSEALTVVVGNPPYAISSSNSAAGVQALLADYKHGLDETNVNALSDDYVKFFRLAHALVVGAGAGAIGLVTNNSFLDGVTHRRMRELLLCDFDEVQIVDLHGSVMRRHEAPAGAGDENVFDIQQGVAITILSRTSANPRPGHVRRADLWGTRQSKFDRLSAGPGSLKWEQPAIAGPYFFFRTAAGAGHDEYRRWLSLAEIFGVYSSGIKFRKDGLLVKNHFTRADAEEMLRDVAALPARKLTAKYGFHETADWQLKDKRALFAHWRPEDIIEVTYRPFDVRYAFYPLDRAGRIIVRGDSRIELMRHVLAVPNIGLVFNRQVVGDQVTHCLVSRRPVSHGTFYLGNKGQDYFAPLYLVNGGQERSNLTPTFVDAVAAGLRAGRSPPGPCASGQPERTSSRPAPSPESVLHYLYALLHGPTYRERYAQQLKVDFPRLPAPGGASLFTALARLGADLVALHLLEHDYAQASWTRAGTPCPLDGPGPILVGTNARPIAPGYPKQSDGRVHLNPACWFEGVPDEAWRFQVGGYHVCEKWLKDRRGRTLSPEDVRRYGQVVRAFAETLRLMSEVDEVIAAHGGWPAAFGRG